jgi:hypothetical protein
LKAQWGGNKNKIYNKKIEEGEEKKVVWEKRKLIIKIKKVWKGWK